MSKRRGRKSAAQTPAPKSEQIKGSKKNPKGTAASELSAARIKLSSDTIGTLKKKLDEFKEKHPKKKNVSLNDLKAVYRRGSGAYSSSHRPTITGGKPNSRAAWSYARVNKFLEKAAGKKVKKAYVQDDDLLENGGKISDKYDLLNKLFSQINDSLQKNGLNIDKDYVIADESGKKFEPIFSSQKDGKEIIATYYEDGFEVLGEIEIEIEDDKVEVEIEFPKWSIKEEFDALESYKEGGLIAPNGKPSNLSPEQYNLVRTPEFKAWFGDWENHPENASKVVDENGEPLVVYHGTSGDLLFYEFMPYAVEYVNGEPIKEFRGNRNDEEFDEYIKQYGLRKIQPRFYFSVRHVWGDKNLQCFLSIKNMYVTDEYTPKISEYDGFRVPNEDGNDYYCVFKSSQIKLADGSNKMFDRENPDIRFAKGGKTKGKGDCYQVAGDFAIGKFFAPKIDFKGEPYIVHAEVTGQGTIEGLRYGHAWVEDDIYVYDYSNNREIIFPKQLYYLIGQVNTKDPKKYQKYTFEEARKKMLDTGNYGSWDIETEYAEGGETDGITENDIIQHIKKTNPHKGSRDAFGGIGSLKNYSWEDKTRLIYPNDIKINKEMLYPASKLDVKRYAKAYNKGSKFPPIVIIEKEKEYEILDGAHRLKAAIDLNVPIEAYVGHTIDSNKFEDGGQTSQQITCVNCDWTWNTSDSDPDDMYVCHKCGFDNTLFYDTDILKPTLSISEIADKHNVDIDYVVEKVIEGTEHELEHTERQDVAKKIALHHIAETPDYYDKLAKLNLEDGGEVIISDEDYEFYVGGDDYQGKAIKANGITVGGIAYDAEDEEIQGIKIENKFRKKGYAKKAVKALFDKNPELQDVYVRATPRAKKFWEKIGTYFSHYNDDAGLWEGGLERYNDGGDILENNSAEVDIQEYLMQQNAEAQEVMSCTDSRVFKAMICKTKIEIAENRLQNADNPEEQNCWNECILIWTDCMNNIIENNIPVREYKDGGSPCGCSNIYEKGGLAYGNSHDKGGIPLEVSSTGQKIEIEGGEGVVNKRSMQITKKVDFQGRKLTPCEVVSKINEMGGGVKFKCSDVKEIIAEDGHF